MLTETITVARMAAPIAGETGLPCDDLANKIRVSIGKGDQYHTTAGILLLEAKRRLPEFGLTWSAYLVGKCKIQTSRAYELIAIAEGRTTVAEVQAKGRERAARFSAKNKAARSSVSNGQSDTPDPRLEIIRQITLKTRDANLSELQIVDDFFAKLLRKRKSGAPN